MDMQEEMEMSGTGLAKHTPAPPYYAVIFTSQRTAEDQGYGLMADRMVELASSQPGFLGVESTRGADGLGITVSYWKDEASIKAWKANAQHQVAQATGKKVWYADYMLRVAKVERAYSKAESDKAGSKG
jgi:heme-degrading monooxygenase HmoA